MLQFILYDTERERAGVYNVVSIAKKLTSQQEKSTKINTTKTWKMKIGQNNLINY